MKKKLVINKTAAYLVAWIGLLYDNKLSNLIKKNSLLTTKFYVHDEIKEEYFGKALFLKCPKEANSKTIFNRLDEHEDVLEIYDVGNDKIVVINFPYPNLFKSIVSGKFSELKNNALYQVHKNHRDLKHIKRIVDRDEVSVKRFQTALKLEIGSDYSLETIRNFNLELVLPFTFEDESMFYTCDYKYIYSLLEEEVNV